MIDRPLRVVDLFCGEMNFSEAFRAAGDDVWTSDFDPVYEPDLVADIRELRASDLPWQPDVLLASPPCQGFTVARMGRNWNRDRTPKTAKAELGLELVTATLNLIREVRPAFWWMENPVGMLRKFRLVENCEHRTVTYCSYGRAFRKPTDLWGGHAPSWRARPMCDAYNGAEVEIGGELWRVSASTGRPCHQSAPRGSTTGVQGRKRLVSTAVPPELSAEIRHAVTLDLGRVRGTLPGDVGQVALFDYGN